MDPTTAILHGLQAGYTTALQTNAPAGDPLAPKTIKISPLQDDPTSPHVAPYVIFRPDPDRGGIPDPRMTPEMGYSWWIYYFQTAVGTPRATNRLDAYSHLGELLRRIQQYLNQDPTLGGLQADEFELTGGQYADRVIAVRSRIYGGETEWYGQAIVDHFFLMEQHILAPMVYS
jgi:hypothetical protein